MISPLISIIVPVYKVEAYLCKCVDSIIAQTYTNLEIILVDDGSPDNCGKICDEYAEKDDRVRVMHKENGGLSDARNAALDAMNGKFIAFVDSDDYVTEDYVQVLYDNLIKYNADISVSGIVYFYEKNKKIEKLFVMHNEEGAYAKEQSIDVLMYQKEFLPSAYAKLYKIKLFENLRYPVGKINEDLATCYLLFARCDKISYCNPETYTYRQRAGSILHKNFDIKLMDAIDVLDEMVDWITKNIPKCKKSSISRLVALNLHIYHHLGKERNIYLEQAKRIEVNIKKYRSIVLFDSNVKKKVRLACMISYFGFGILRFMFSIVKRNGEV